MTLDGTPAHDRHWTDTTIAVTVPAGTPAGPHQLEITADNGQHTVNGLTFHVLGTGYNPTVREVGPGKTYATIQAALDAAFTSNLNDLVVVYPGTPDLANPRNNPRGAYYENLIIASPVKLQGVGPGGFQGNDFVPGLDHRRRRVRWGHRPRHGLVQQARHADLGRQPGRDRRRSRLRAGLAERHDAPRPGAPVHQRVQGRHRRLRHPRWRPAGLPGQHQRPHRRADRPAAERSSPRAARSSPTPMRATCRSPTTWCRTTAAATAPSGSARLTWPRRTPTSTTRTCGSPTTGSSPTPAPTWPAASGCSPARTATRSPRNDICGNFSLEYGGGVSVYGRSPGGKIHHNRIYFNMSNDEGGGIMIAGELPADRGRRSRRAPARWTSTPTRSRPTCPTTTAAASGS